MSHTQPNIRDGGTISDTRVALTEFRMMLLAALGGLSLPEMAALGFQDMSGSLEDVYPINSGDPIFAEIVGDSPSITEFGEIFFRLKTKDYGAGIMEKALRLRTAEWARRGWGTMPAKHAAAMLLLLEEVLAASFEAGAATPSCENKGTSTAIKVFGASKPSDPANPKGDTYTNLHTSTALTVDNIDAMRTSFRTQKGPGGKPRGYELTHIVCGADKESSLLSYLKDDLIVYETGSSATVSATLIPNKLKKFKPIIPVINTALTDTGVWYPVAAEPTGGCPWTTLVKRFADSAVNGMPSPAIQMADGIEWIVLDETSDHYKVGSKLGPAGTLIVIPKVRVGAGIHAPWRIKRCEP